MPRLVAVEHVMEDARAARFGQELGTEPNQAARNHQVLHAHPTRSVVDHLLEPPLAQSEQLSDHADVLLRRVDRQLLHRLVQPSVDVAGYHLRLADGELETFAPHQFDQHSELQLTAALDLPRVRPRSREHTNGDVSDQLLREPRFDHARRQTVAVPAGER